MNRRLQAAAILVVAAVAGAAGFYLSRASLNSPAADGAAQRLMSASMLDLGGAPLALSQWRGKVLLVNFWATWCAPCREEMPVLMRIQHKYASNGLKLVGIAIDNASKVRQFSDQLRLDYTLVIGGMETLDLSKSLGNRAGVLPYTVVLDRGGNVAFVHAGSLTEAALDAVLSPLL